jgi:hypothetical protein
MDEDVLGPRQSVLGQRYDRCTRCGALDTREALTPEPLPGEGPRLGPLHPLEATREAPPALLCARCAREVAAGEPLEMETAPGDVP